MPFFSFTIETEKNTPASNPKKTSVRVSAGVLHRVVIRVPPGPRGTLSFFVAHHLHQIIPTSSGEVVSGDDMNIDYDEFYPLFGTDTLLDVYSWNVSTLYDHSFILMFGILPEWVLLPMLSPPASYQPDELGFGEIDLEL